MHATRALGALAGAVLVAALIVPVGAWGGRLAGARVNGGPDAQVAAAIATERSALAQLATNPVRSAAQLRLAAADLQAAAGATGVPATVAAELQRTRAADLATAHVLGSATRVGLPAAKRTARTAIGAAVTASVHALASLRAVPAAAPAAAAASPPAQPSSQGTIQWCAFTTLGGVTPLETFLISDPAGAGKRASVNMVRGEANTFSTVTLDATGAGSVTYPVPGANYILVQITELEPAGPPRVLVGSFFVDPLTVASATGCTLHS